MVSLLPAKTYSHCVDLLVRCDEFQSNDYLRTVFIVEDLARYRDEIPEGKSIAERVHLLIDFLVQMNLSHYQPLNPHMHHGNGKESIET